MVSETSCVLVTGIGGNVGQGILRNVRSAYPNLRVVGTDIGLVTAGHHFCDAFHQVPYCYEKHYGDTITTICSDECIDVIIPATDYEAFHLGTLSADLPSVISSPPDVTRICLDKYETHQAFSAAGLRFAPSCLPADYRDQWEHVVVKPRKGRGSQGIEFDPTDVHRFDATYVVQQRLTGVEITSSFYVTKLGEVMGPITFQRELVAGMTERCQTTAAFDTQLEDYIGRLVSVFPFRGPVNLQAMAKSGEPIVPFEINCRYSGTNSIRAQFGFEDVRYGLQEYLFHQDPDRPHISHGSAIRVVMDIIYRELKLGEIEAGDRDSFIS